MKLSGDEPPERLRREPHPYDAGHYLRLESGDGKHAMIFETDGAVVTSFRSGRRGPVAWIEGRE